jgi:hypothetical protein
VRKIGGGISDFYLQTTVTTERAKINPNTFLDIAQLYGCARILVIRYAGNQFMPEFADLLFHD